MNRNALQSALVSLLLLAVASVLSGLALWFFFLIGKDFFPGVLTFSYQSVSVITSASLLVGLIIVTTLDPQLLQSFLAQLVLFLALSLGMLLGQTLGNQTSLSLPPSPAPTPGRFTQTIEGNLFWEENGGAILQSRFSDQIIVYERVEFDPVYQRFVTTNPLEETNLRWIGHSDVYFQPPGSLSDLINDLQILSTIMGKYLEDPASYTNLAIFILGLLSLITICRSIALLHFPRIITTIAAIIFVRLGIALIRFSWFEAPQILANWFTDLNPHFAWLYSGWMPASLGFCLMFISTYQQSITTIAEEGDGSSI